MTPQFAAEALKRLRIQPSVLASGDRPSVKPTLRLASEQASLLKLYQLLLDESRWGDEDLQRNASGQLVLPVCFLDGNEKQRQCVREIAPEWTRGGGANGIVFEFVSGSSAAVKISFRPDQGYWSLVGNAAKTDAVADRATLTLPNLSEDPTDEHTRFYVLHEFGHVLGLLHEHEHPDAGFQWNVDKIVDDLLHNEFKNRSRQFVQDWVSQEITAVYSADYRCDKTMAFDQHSIMIYPIRPGWANKTTQQGHALTNGDLVCAHKAYG